MVSSNMNKGNANPIKHFTFFIFLQLLIFVSLNLQAHEEQHFEVTSADMAEAGTLTFNPNTGKTDLAIQLPDRLLAFELSSNSAFIANWESLKHDTELQLYRGTINGGAGNSWVRLSVTNEGIKGAFYDGNELHMITPVAELMEYLEGSELLPDRRYDANDVMIYRVSDIRHNSLCALDGSNHNDLNKFNYSAFVDELVELASAAADKNINVSVVADTEYDAATGGDGLNQMLAEMNVVDGIFSEQVGLQLTVSSSTVLSDNGNMTSTDAETLLGQFGVFTNTQTGNPGLSHLFTGKDLNGSTVGIAYVGAACTVFGTAVTQRFGSVTSLIAAHEFGHNMGAPHDNQAGSACSATPNGFLMNPSINGSSTFSDCSLGQMQSYIAGASCIVDISGQPPIITSTPSDSAVAGIQYDYDANNRLEASGTDPITFVLDFGPEGMVVSDDGLVTWTPTLEQTGTQSAQITATNDFGTDSQAFDVEVVGSFINLNENSPVAYGRNQDGVGEVTVNALGNQITLLGNRWQSIPFPYLITSDTVLEFDYLSTQQGEIQGIGLDNNDALSPQWTFNLYGTQRWGLRSIRYSTPGIVERFRIPIGQYYTGQMQNIFFANDHDVADPNAHSQFSNINVYENSSAEVLNFFGFEVVGYGGNQDGEGSVEILEGGTALKLTGNRWQKIDLPVTITRDTIIEFEFKTDATGEIHGIGFDKDTSISANLTFQVHGTQSWGLGNFQYTGDGEYQKFVIPVGNFYTGTTNVLFFVNDHDVESPTATSYFRNIIVR